MIDGNEEIKSAENGWHRNARIIGVLAACLGFSLLLIDDLIPRYQQGLSLFSGPSEFIEFLLLCPGFGILALLSAQYIYQREYDLQRKIERLEAKRFVALGRIAGSIAHEVRNPLQNIMLVREELANHGYADQQDLMKHLGDNIERINMAVKLVYELAKPSYQMEDDFVNNISLTHIVHMAVESTRQNFSVPIEVEGLEENMHVVGHADGLVLALENVLRNAAQYCESAEGPAKGPAKGSVEGCAGQGNSNSEHICITVKSDRHHHHLQIRNKGRLPKELLLGESETFTSKQAGLGLGLFITRHVLERMQGKMKIEQSGDYVEVVFILKKGMHYDI